VRKKAKKGVEKPYPALLLFQDIRREAKNEKLLGEQLLPLEM
jgi:hypothetical protein